MKEDIKLQKDRFHSYLYLIFFTKVSFLQWEIKKLMRNNDKVFTMIKDYFLFNHSSKNQLMHNNFVMSSLFIFYLLFKKTTNAEYYYHSTFSGLAQYC